MGKTGEGLAEYAISQIGNPYWYGTWGQTATERLWVQKAGQYPTQYTSARHKTMVNRGDIGKKVHDCSGLIKAYLMDGKYQASLDYSADSFKTAAGEKGDISTIPEIVGLGVWKSGHIGVYIGGGEVVEAIGFAKGVQRTKLADRPFKLWLNIPCIEYPEQSADIAGNGADASSDALEAVASEVIAGKWGNGAERKSRLSAAGYDYDAVQAVVNQKLGESKSGTATGTVNTQKDALNVRAGAGMTFRVVKTLAKGTKVTVKTPAVGGWYALADGTGYVSAKFIKI